MNFCYICYIIVVIKKDKYGFLSLLHLKVTNIYTYSLNLYQNSHIFREGNSCADKLANMGHAITGAIWLDTLPAGVVLDFFRDRCGLPNYRFP
jgi:hypothetical protein